MKLFFIFSFIFFFTNIFAQDTQKCLNKSKEFFEQKEYSYAQKTLGSCLKNDPKNIWFKRSIFVAHQQTYHSKNVMSDSLDHSLRNCKECQYFHKLAKMLNGFTMIPAICDQREENDHQNA